MLTFKQALWLQLLIIEVLLGGLLSLVTLNSTLIAVIWLAPIVFTSLVFTLAQKQEDHEKQQAATAEKLLQANLTNTSNSPLSVEEQSAEKLNSLYLKALEQIPEGVLVYQKDTLRFANPTAMAMLKVNHLEELKIEHFFPSDLQKKLLHCRQNGDPFISAIYNIIDNQFVIKQVRIRVSTEQELSFIFIEHLLVPTSTSAITTTNKKSLAGCTILLVEDSQANQLLMKSQLEQQDVEVDCANDGEQGLKLARQKAYDLILMDLQMPIMDGISAAKHIRNLPQHATTPIVAMSGTQNEETDTNIEQAGINGFIQKPLSYNELIKHLNRFLTQTNAHSSSSTDLEKPPSPQPIFNQAVLTQMQTDIGKQRANDMTQIALAEIEKSLTTLSEEFEYAPLMDMKRCAHTLKSTSASFGLISLSHLCHQIELACRDDKKADTSALIQEAREVFMPSKQLLMSYLVKTKRDESC